MRAHIKPGDIDSARKVAGYIGGHANAWEHGMVVTVEAYVPIRSQKQNGLYRALLQRFGEASGARPSDLHTMFTNEFAPRRIITYKERQVSVPISSSEWTKEQMSSMIERVKHEAAELNYNLD